ncbi:hypothetical protein [Labilibaculum sp.]|uniref:hypothetical protein n=1 Tax=Labilibaculum sp. TaxID=2060723 RepID=UPI002AA960B8|nr:hypothetical protein [Labilibaculum sp.]
MILHYSLTVFFTQLIFIGCRTWNVQAVSKNHIPQALISGVFVNLSWLVSIAIGAVSMFEIINNFKWEFLPIVVCSVAGGTIGSYIAMRAKRR